MDIFSAPDTRIVLSRLTSGLECDREHAKKHLQVDKNYIVEKVKITNGSSAVYLKEVPGEKFNTVLFENVGAYYRHFYFHDERNRLLRVKIWTGDYDKAALHLIDADGTPVPYPMTWAPNGNPPRTFHENRDRFVNMQAAWQLQATPQQ